MLTFCRLSVVRAARLALRHQHRHRHSQQSSPVTSAIPDAAAADHDYLRLQDPDPPSHSSDRQSPPAIHAAATADHDYLRLQDPDPPSPSSDHTAESQPATQPCQPDPLDEWPARVERLRTSRGLPAREAVIATSFGVIRLDADNQPRTHGQFEPGVVGDGAEADGVDEAWRTGVADAGDHVAAGAATGGDGLEAPRDASRWKTSDAARGGSPEDMDLGQAAGRRELGRPCPAPHTSAAETCPSSDEDERCSSNDESGHPAAQPAREEVPNRPRRHLFEEQYFSETLDTGATGPDTPHRSEWDPSLPEVTAERAKLSGKPESVFDEQYFWNAFEDTGERQEMDAFRAGLIAKHVGREQGAPSGEDNSDRSPPSQRTTADKSRRRDTKQSSGKPASSSPSQRMGKTTGPHRDRNVAGLPMESDAERQLKSRPYKTEKQAKRKALNEQDEERSRDMTDARPKTGVDAMYDTGEGGEDYFGNQTKTGRSPRAGGKTSNVQDEREGARKVASDGRKTGMDVVRELRKEARERATPTNSGLRLRAEAADLADQPSYTVASLLSRSVLHDSPDLVVLYKPFGLSIDAATARCPHRLTDFLPALARRLRCEHLHLVHSLERDASGALLLAKSADAARAAQEQLQSGEARRTYWALVRGVPDPPQGVIDMPLAESAVPSAGRQGGMIRMTPSTAGGGTAAADSRRAVTRYRTLSRAADCALVELVPSTGVKHQLRAHLGLGLACPLLGDHKYSRWDCVLPQRLPGSVLAALRLRPGETRHLPLHLHSRAVWLAALPQPVCAPLPLFFKKNLRRLHVRPG